MLTFCLVVFFVANLFQEIKSDRVSICGSDEFPCNDGSCVDKMKWCDSRSDCDDDSDELYCFVSSGIIRNPNRCNETLFFICHNGECIPTNGRCDGFSSCLDNSDEENCGTGGKDADLYTEMAIQLNGNYKSSNIHEHKNLMQGHNVSHVTETIVKIADYTARESNLTDHSSSNFALKETVHHEALKDDHSIDAGNHSSKHSTHLETNSGVLKNPAQALEFHDALGLLNVSRKEQNTTTDHYHPSTSRSFNGNSSQKVFALGGETFKVSGNKSVISHKAEVSHTVSIPTNNEDIKRGYVKLNTRDYRQAKEKAEHWLLHSRDQEFGWGEETARALIALHMTDYPFKKSDDTTVLMSNNLHLRLFTLMSWNETKMISLAELALYINALAASCDNPRNFHGHDLVKILRHRTTIAQESSQYVPPFVYLVLCLNNEISNVDITNIHKHHYYRIDTAALMSLAATCISRKPEFLPIIGELAAKTLLDMVTTHGLPRNIYELALLTQALNAAKVNQNLWNRTEAMHRIVSWENNGSFGDILSTYYVIPILSGKSFLSIGRNCPLHDPGLSPLEILKNGKSEKMYVHFSLLFGNPVEVSQSLMVQVQKNTSFFDIMRIAATINPAYKFKYDVNEDKLSVYSFGGLTNDAEKGLYWSPYISRNSAEELIPFESDIRSFIPAVGQYVAFWRK